MRRKDTDTGGISITDKRARQTIAEDLEGYFPMLDSEVVIGRKVYKIFDAPSNGSCMYHAFEAIMRPHVEDSLPPIVQQAQLISFYSARGEIQRQFQELLGVDFQDRLRDVMSWDSMMIC